MKKFILICVVIFSVSCKKTDTTKPTLSVFSPNDNSTFSKNDTILFDAIFYDNKSLEQYRFQIKNNFTANEDSLPPWNLTLVNNIEGTEQAIQLEIIIPDTIFSGMYYCIVKCVDEAGNEAASDTTAFSVL